jgi:glycosyltransferase involved in cell wall biosynthesis
VKIAYILPAFPDLYKSPSGHLRPYHFIRELAKRHSITLFALTSGEISSEAQADMKGWTEQVLAFDLNGGKVPSRNRGVRAWRARQAVKNMKRSFQQVTARESFDVVLFQGKHTFPVIAGCKLPVVVDFCDATSYRMRQSMRYAGISDLPWRSLRYLEVRHFEKKLLRKSQYRAFISGRDRQAILGDRDSSRLVANGIDLEFWTRKTHAPQPNCMVYTGVMEYPPNADGALYLIREILPLVRKSVPDVKLFVVGRNPSATLVDAARPHPNVTVTGYVDDMRPYLEQASVYVAPLRFASGMQNKLLEAMAMEIPVVTTPIGAQGIQMEGAEDLPVCVAQGEIQFAQSVVALMNDKENRTQLAAAGRAYTETHFNWSRSAAQLEQLCMEAVAQASASSGKLSRGNILQATHRL